MKNGKFGCTVFLVDIVFAAGVIINNSLLKKVGNIDNAGSIWSLFIAVLLLDLLLILANRSQEEKAESDNSNSILISAMKVVAAVGVFLCHTGDCTPFPDSVRRYTTYLSSGVEIFFVISGFTIMRSLQQSRRNTIYAVKRVFRILPLYYCIIIVLYLFTQVTNHPLENDSTGLGWIRYLCLLSTVVPTEQDCWVNLCATWTVPTFFVFYFLALPLIENNNEF